MESFLPEVCVIVMGIAWIFYKYSTKHYDYWKKRAVPYVKPEFPFGSLKNIILTKTYFAKRLHEMYNDFPNERFFGIILPLRPVLVIKDPTLVKQILIKDFHHFVDRIIYEGNPQEYMVNRHLFTMAGQEWKSLRTKLTPLFSFGKVKNMLELMNKCCEKLIFELKNNSKYGKPVDAKRIFSKFTMETTSCCLFGLDSNTICDGNSKFYRIFEPILYTSVRAYIRRMLFLSFPSIIKSFRLNLIGNDKKDFVMEIVKSTLKYRQDKNVNRNDVFDVLKNRCQTTRIQEESSDTDAVINSPSPSGKNMELIAANVFALVVAGSETSSSLMSFCLYELSLQPDLQEQLHQSVLDAVEAQGGQLCYESLRNMTFLDQVIKETLRMYGSLQFLSRVCTEPYKLPGSSLVVEKGAQVYIPLCSIQRDPKYYEEPDKFNPDRFAPEEVKKREQFVYMPFGAGPRKCIGDQFGLMQAKIGLATVILNFYVNLSPEQEVPIEISKRSLALLPANPVQLEFVKRKSD